MDSYSLSRSFWNWCFANPEKITPYHISIYFFAVEHCNRLGWKEKFGFPASMVTEATGIGSYNTYIKCFNDLCAWGFIKLIEKSKNQWSSNIIALCKNDKALDKALDKAMIKHSTKHSTKQCERTIQSTSSIDKQVYNEPGTRYQELVFGENKKHLFKDSEFYDFEKFCVKMDEDEVYKPFDYLFYHEALKNWSVQGNKKIDWIGTAKSFMQKDSREKKTMLKKQFQTQYNNGKSNAPETPEQLLARTLEFVRNKENSAANIIEGEHFETK